MSSGTFGTNMPFDERERHISRRAGGNTVDPAIRGVGKRRIGACIGISDKNEFSYRI
jgi:hypothetical protein